jgi:death-on-curing protein
MDLSEILFLEYEEVLQFHADQLGLFGGQDGIRDDGVLRSALAMPEATYDGAYLHADQFMMAAAYAFHIAEGQPFVDGNKRTGLNAALVFLELNGWSVEDPQEELYDAMIGLATGKHTKSSLADVFRRLSRYVND